MACVMDLKLNQHGEAIPWDPAQIPSTKPFVNIATTAHEPLSTTGDMKFIKTNSSIYSSFHKNTRRINFEIGYSKNATWFDSLSEKWSEYVYFFVGGFYEETYSTDEIDPSAMLTQIDARIIDYDARFRQANTLPQPKSSTSLNPLTSAFAQQRSASSSAPQTPQQTLPSQSQFQSHNITPTISKHDPFTLISRQSSDNSVVIMEDTENDDDQLDLLRTDLIVMEDVSEDPLTAKQKDLNQLNDTEFDEFYSFYQKFKTQKSQQSQIHQSDAFKPIATLQSYDSISGLANSEQDVIQSKKWNLSDLCDLEDKPLADDQQNKVKRTYRKRSSKKNEQDEQDEEQNKQDVEQDEQQVKK